MNIPTTLIFAFVVMAWIASGAAIFVIVPRYLRSMFRYKMWEVRDAIVDDVFDGKLPSTRLVNAMKSGIERMILESESVTLLQWAIGPNISKEMTAKFGKQADIQLRALSNEERELFLRHKRKAQSAVLRHLFLGTPLGWIFTGMVSLVLLFVMLFTGICKLVKNGAVSLQSIISAPLALLDDLVELQSFKLLLCGMNSPDPKPSALRKFAA